MARLALFFFGPPRIELDNAPIKVSRHKAIALLAYLAVTHQTHSRNTLATLLWPNQDQSRARAALRRTLTTLNKAGIGEWLEIDRNTIGLKDTSELWVDARRFHYLLTTCLAAQKEADDVCIPLLTEAVDLYTGDFLAGFTLRDSPDFDEWQLSQAEALRYDLGSALARLVRCYSSRSDFESAIVQAQRWLRIDPLYELAHRQLMQLYVWNNQRAAALRQYQECARVLKQELDVEPSPETTELYQRIQQGEESQKSRPKYRQLTTPLRLETPLHNFPAQPTPFIGRQTSLPQIAKRLQNPYCRLLTLVGPGGIGKTRLAIQAAIELSHYFSDGLYFVPLTSVSSPDFLAYTVAENVGLPLDGQADPRPQLLNYLQHKHMLLILDNFEHLTKNADLLLDMLNYAPDTKILVTSRERLNLQEEWAFEVKGMSYPLDIRTGNIEAYSAVALFLQRAYRVDSGFHLTQVEKPHIVRICQLVQGIPLGIELAATWVRVLSCREIAKEIERMYTTPNNLDFLATSLQDVPKRHQSLRLVFEHSWQYLSPEEQRVFRQLSVFHGGCTREAIEAVTGASLFLVSVLVDKSLLARNTPQRYEMHELLRQYAVEKLRQIPEEAADVQRRHCEYYASFLEEREKKLKGDTQKEALAEIAGEFENVRACWQWAVSHQKSAEIEKAIESLWYFFAMYSRFQEGAKFFGQAAAQFQQANNHQTASLLGRLLTHQGWFLLRQGHYEQANALLQQSVDIFERLGEQKHAAAPLHHLGILAGEVGEPAEAKRLLEQSLAIYRKFDDQWGVAWSLSNLAYRLSELGAEHYAQAEKFLQESLTIYKSVGNRQGVAIALNNLGFIAYRQANYPTSKQLLQESLVLRREAGFPRGIAVTLNNLGHVTAALKDYSTCKTYYYESLKIASNIQALPTLMAALGGIAVPLAREGKAEQALELLFLALHHPASNKETQDRAMENLAKLKEKIPPEVFTTIQTQAKEQPRPLDIIVTEVLILSDKNSSEFISSEFLGTTLNPELINCF